MTTFLRLTKMPLSATMIVVPLVSLPEKKLVTSWIKVAFQQISEGQGGNERQGWEVHASHPHDGHHLNLFCRERPAEDNLFRTLSLMAHGLQSAACGHWEGQHTPICSL